jgi:hypothetical protein
MGEWRNGRRAWLRTTWGNPCRFKSCLAHQIKEEVRRKKEEGRRRCIFIRTLYSVTAGQIESVYETAAALSTLASDLEGGVFPITVLVCHTASGLRGGRFGVLGHTSSEALQM